MLTPHFSISHTIHLFVDFDSQNRVKSGKFGSEKAFRLEDPPKGRAISKNGEATCSMSGIIPFPPENDPNLRTR